MSPPFGIFGKAEMNFEVFMQRKGNQPGQTHQSLESGF